MALRIAFAAKNPFALDRARREFIEEHAAEVVRSYGTGDRICMTELQDGTELYLVSESAWRCGSYDRKQFDQIFRVGPEPLGIDFMLELQECLKGSQVPEEWQWQKWISPELQFKPEARPGVRVMDVSLVPEGGYPINTEDGWKPVRYAEKAGEADA